MKKRSFFLIFFCSLTFSSLLHAQELDPDFRPEFSRVAGVVNEVLLQGDNKILLSGSFDYIGNRPANRRLSRLLPDGQEDPSFTLDPKIALSSAFRAKIVQPDDKILIGGSFHDPDREFIGNLLRLLPDGSLDTTFNFSGDRTWEVQDIDILPDQKILLLTTIQVPGQDDLRADRVNVLNPDGSLFSDFPEIQDEWESFGDRTMYGISAYADSSFVLYGQMLELGEQTANLFRLDVQGAVDMDFHPPESMRTGARISAVEKTPAGLIGVVQLNSTVSMLTGSGELLRSVKLNEGPQGLTAAGDSMFLFYTKDLYQINPDTAFSYSIGASSWRAVWDLAIRPDGALLVAGNFINFDEVFASGLFRTEPIENGKDLQIDLGFNAAINRPGIIYDVQLLNDGKLLVGGFFQVVNGRRAVNVVRLLPDGSLDTTFNLELSKYYTPIYEIDTLSNGNYVFGSQYTFTEENDKYLSGVNITDQDGNILKNFSPYPYGFNGTGTISFLEVDSEDHIYAGESGQFDQIVPEDGRQLVKYDTAGNLLIDFADQHLDLLTDRGVYREIILQPDDRLLLFGNKMIYDGFGPTSLVRAEKNGTLDNSFKFEVREKFSNHQAILLHDGSMLIEGSPPASVPYSANATYLYKIDQNGKQDFRFNYGSSVCPIFYTVDNTFVGEIAPGRVLVVGSCNKIYSDIEEPFQIIIDEYGRYLDDFAPGLGVVDIDIMAVGENRNFYLGGQFNVDGRIMSLVRVQGLPPTNTRDPRTYDSIGVSVFPNPLAGGEALFLKVDAAQFGGSLTYEIMEGGTGRVLLRGRRNEPAGRPIDVSDLSAGFYVIRVRSEGRTGIVKWIKQ
ncbi:hypothetical protein [Flavilitoribacter nigricans]|nr:hypothetical protein [Flavilitoribacter nigricans]